MRLPAAKLMAGPPNESWVPLSVTLRLPGSDSSSTNRSVPCAQEVGQGHRLEDAGQQAVVAEVDRPELPLPSMVSAPALPSTLNVLKPLLPPRMFMATPGTVS